MSFGKTEYVLHNGTVQDLIGILQRYPKDAKIFIEDADTLWTISSIHFRRDKDGVWLWGEYYEMQDDITELSE